MSPKLLDYTEEYRDSKTLTILEKQRRKRIADGSNPANTNPSKCILRMRAESSTDRKLTEVV